MKANLYPPGQPRPPRHLLRWIILGMALLILAGVFVIFNWNNSDTMPGFAKIWKLRASAQLKQIRSGRDSQQTQLARWLLAEALFAQGSYGSAENQYRANLASQQRVHGTNSLESYYALVEISGCLFLEGKQEEAVQHLRRALTDSQLQPGLEPSGLRLYALGVPQQVAALGRLEDATALAKFTFQQAQEVHKDNPVQLQAWETQFQRAMQQIASSPIPESSHR